MITVNDFLTSAQRQQKILYWTNKFFDINANNTSNRNRIDNELKDKRTFLNFVRDLDMIKTNQNDELKKIIGTKIISSSSFVIADEILKILQKKPKYVCNLIQYSFYNDRDYFLSNSKYFKQLFLYATSSFYDKGKNINIKNKIEALSDLQKICSLINDNRFSFEEILNTIIYQDYACGNEQRKIFLNDNEHNNEINQDQDINKITEILKSNNLIDNNIKTSPDVLAFYQNIKNNKLYFSANVVNNNDLNGKTLTEVIFEKFSTALSKNSIQRLISTLGFNKTVHYTKHNNFQKNSYENANALIANNFADLNKRKKIKNEFIKDTKDIIKSIFGNTTTLDINYNNTNDTINVANFDNTDDEENVQDTRYKRCDSNLIDRIANSKNFKQIDLKYKILSGKDIKSTYNINNVAFDEVDLEKVFFKNFRTKKIETIKNITNIEQFELLKKENIDKIIDSLVAIDITTDVPFDNENETSCIIETAKRLYFHNNTNEEHKEKIINYIVNYLSNNNDKTKSQLIGNSLIIDSKEPRVENRIKIQDFDFLQAIVNNIRTKIENEEDYEVLKKYRKSFCATIKNITSSRVLELIMFNKLFSEKKIIQETLEILYKKENNLIVFWDTNKESFIKRVLQYINIPTNDNFDDNLNTLKLLAKEKYEYSINLLSKKINKNLIKDVILVKTLADGILYVDFNEIYDQIIDLVKDANSIYNNVEKFNNINQEEHENLSKIKISLKKYVLDGLKKCKQNIIDYMIKAPDNKDLITRKDIIYKLIKFIELQIENQAIDEISYETNGVIQDEIYGLLEHFKKIKKQYNDFVKCYNDQKSLKKYNYEQNLLMKNTKKRLINSIKTKIIEKQKEWEEIFEKYKDVNNNDLKKFFEHYYNSIDDYACQILECVKQYNGNDIESLQKQTQANVEKLEEKISIFDSKIQKSINITEKYNENIIISSKKGSNIANAVINYNNDNFQKNKQAERKNVSNFLQKSKDILLNDVVTKNDNNRFLFDKKQTILASFGLSSSSVLGIAGVLTGNPLFIIIGGCVFASDMICLIFRKSRNNKINESNNFELQQKLYEHAFKKQTGKIQQKKKKEKDKLEDVEEAETEDEVEEEIEEDEEKRKDIKNTNTTDLKDTQQQPELS